MENNQKKQCSSCKELKDLSEFHLSSKNSKPVCKCKKCVSEYNRQYRSNPEKREKLLEDKRKDYFENRDYYRDSQKQYRKDNREKVLVQKRGSRNLYGLQQR